MHILTMNIPPIISPDQAEKLECAAMKKYLDYLSYSKNLSKENVNKIWNQKYANMCS